ncbi:MAG: hypothetical protein HY290_11735 [Planctomycetia bacterium]|nr:hypothetical protein [Planctomycetia bacterium]
MSLRSNCWSACCGLAIAGAALFLWDPPLGRRGEIIYVAPDGCDWNSGATPATAIRTLQRAADVARPGDRVIIRPGTYFERVHVRRGGLPGQPVTFEAAEPGSVHITGALAGSVPADWNWSDDGDGIFSTHTRQPVYALACDDEALFRVPWGGVKALREFAGRPRAWGAFWYEKGRLHVSLREQRHPGRSRLKTHAPVPEPREWGEFKSANVWVESDHVAFSGLQFEMGIGAGLLVWNATDVAIRECAFHGAAFGVKCGTGAKPSKNVLIENCLYENYPQYFWHRDWLSWDECYAGYASSSLVTAVDDGTRVVSNLVVHAGDGLRITTRDSAVHDGVEAVGNWLAFCTDDAIELDGHASHVSVLRNVVIECHEAFSASPVLSGPVTIAENLILNPSGGINGAQLKMLRIEAGAGPPSQAPTANLDVHHNLAFGNWLCWYDRGPFENVRVHDNVFCVSRQNDPPWPDAVADSDNVVDTVDQSAHSLVEMMARLRSAAERDPPHASLYKRNRQLLQIRAGPSWLDWNSLPATRSLEELVRPRGE